MFVEPNAELKDLGYQPMFACRKTMAEAHEYVQLIGKACGPGNEIAVITAATVLLNTYIKLRYDHDTQQGEAA